MNAFVLEPRSPALCGHLGGMWQHHGYPNIYEGHQIPRRRYVCFFH
jgi:hypothetical protein